MEHGDPNAGERVEWDRKDGSKVPGLAFGDSTSEGTDRAAGMRIAPSLRPTELTAPPDAPPASQPRPPRAWS